MALKGQGTFSREDPTLTALAGLTTAANKIPYFTGEDTAAVADLPSGYNYIINPAFEINQRGVASVSTALSHPVDMWTVGTSGGYIITASQQTFTPGQTDVPGEPLNYLRYVSVDGSNTGDYATFYQNIESVRVLAGQTATLSFWAKANETKSVSIEFVQDFGSGGSARVTSIDVTKITLSSTWTRYVLDITIPTISGKTIGTSSHLRVLFWLGAGSDFNARTNSLGNQSGTFELANVKLEAGTVATPFRVPTYAEELQKCMRYLRPLGNKLSVYERLPLVGYGGSTTTGQVMMQLNPPMRTIPTLITPTSYANFAAYDGTNFTALSADPTIAVASTPENVAINFTVASGLTQYRWYMLTNNNQITDAMYLSAEL